MSGTNSLVVPAATTIGERFRLARATAGLTRNEMARAIGVSRSTLQRIEEGSRPPRRGEVIAAAHVTRQDVEFFGGASSDGAPILPDPLPLVNGGEA